MVLHPDKEVNASELAPEITAALAALGFTATVFPSKAVFKSIGSFYGESEDLIRKQRIRSIGPLTEKRTRVHLGGNTVGTAEQIVGLYVGPISALRCWRKPPPLIHDILPYHFWICGKLVKFDASTTGGFPNKADGTLEARLQFELVYANGEPAELWAGTTRCRVRAVDQEDHLRKTVGREAVEITCEEELLFGNKTQTRFHKSQYFPEIGWSVPIEDRQTIKIGSLEAPSTEYRHRLLSFE